MSETSFPVTVAVTRPDGTVEQVRVGTAVKREDGFSLRLGEVSIGSVADRPGEGPKRKANAGEAVFPPYGRSKGAPIAGASSQDLEYYANGARRTLDDQSKARWHDKERALLAAIDAEIARQGKSGPADNNEPPPPGDDDQPF